MKYNLLHLFKIYISIINKYYILFKIDLIIVSVIETLLFIKKILFSFTMQTIAGLHCEFIRVADTELEIKYVHNTASRRLEENLKLLTSISTLVISHHRDSLCWSKFFKLLFFYNNLNERSYYRSTQVDKWYPYLSIWTSFQVRKNRASTLLKGLIKTPF